jgi:hypothetical protein
MAWRIEGRDEGSATGWSTDAIVGSASESENVFPNAADAWDYVRDLFSDDDEYNSHNFRVVKI